MSLPLPPPLPPPRALNQQGYLLRYETFNGRSGWKRRWAVLRDHCLYLYRDPDSQECLYALLLGSARVTQSHDSTGQYRSSIKLEEPNQLAAYLSTGTPEEFDTWYRALSAASGTPVHRQWQQRREINSAGSGQIQSNPDMYGSNYTVVTSSDIQRYRHQSKSSDFNNYQSGSHGRHRQLTVSQPNLAAQPPPPPPPPPPRPLSEYQTPYAVASVTSASAGGSADSPSRAEPEEPQYAVVRDSGTATAWRQQKQQQQQQINGIGHASNGYGSRSRQIETVREDPTMDDSQVLATAPLEEIRRRYPVSGLAKRMSIAASDLLGKPHDELLLLLIQLQREKATLERRREHCLRLAGLHSASSATAERLRQEIREAEQQMELSEPLLSFIANIIAMGAMYQGDDLAFVSEYRRHLLQPGEAPRPARPVIGQQRRRQEAEVARQCQQRPVNTDLHRGGFIPEGDELSGDAEFRRTRRQLEAELASLEAAYAEHRRRKSGLADFMADLGRRSAAAAASASGPAAAARQRRQRAGTYVETDLDTGECVDLAAKFPRRGGIGSGGAGNASLRAAVSTPALNQIGGYGVGYGEVDNDNGYFGEGLYAGTDRRQLLRNGDSIGLEGSRRPRVGQAFSVTSLNAPIGASHPPPPLPQRRFAANDVDAGPRSATLPDQQLNDSEEDAATVAADRKARIRRVLAGYSLQQFTRQELGGLSLAEERRRRELAMAEREQVGAEASRLAIRGYLL